MCGQSSNSILFKDFKGQIMRHLIMAGVFAVLAAPGQAFDTGHHWDATAFSMKKAGFADEAIEIAVATNWMVDLYSSAPFGTGSMKDTMTKLHFDNLFSPDEIDSYWLHLQKNFADAVEEIAGNDSYDERDKVIRLIMLTAMALHAIQDFYTHSNWPDVVRGSADHYATETYLSLPGLPQAGAESLVTGYYEDTLQTEAPATHLDHGGYFDGLNKDSHIRPGWDEAFVFASLETRRFLVLTSTLVNNAQSGLWQAMLDFDDNDLNSHDRGELEDDLRNAYKLSMFVETPGEVDGHWKGNLSGVAIETITAGLGYSAFDIDSFVVNIVQTGELQNMLVPCLYGCSVPSFVAYGLPSGTLPLAVTVSIPWVENGNSTVDFTSKADYFPNFTIGNDYESTDRVFDDIDVYHSDQHVIQGEQADAWTQMYLVDRDQREPCTYDAAQDCVTIRVSLFDFDTPDPNDPVDISSNGDTLKIQYRLSDGFMDGEIPSGYYNTRETAVLSKGSGGDWAKIKIYISHKELLR